MPGYIPSTPEQQREMLAAVGMRDSSELFADIPESVRLRRRLHLPQAMTEPEVTAHLRGLAARNADTYPCFLGAGAYDHYIPSVISHLISRSEFQTAYTPYQPEISQGTLQAVFEYQTMICELTGMDIANASLYDGATAFAEAAAMACAIRRRKRIILSGALHPHARQVVSTYMRFKGIETVTCGCRDGRTDLDRLEALLSGDTAAVLLQSPGFYGAVEDMAAAAELAHRDGALLVAGCDPISLALLRSPGECGADIAVGEGQSLGNPLSFGGPYLGFFAVKKEFMRKMPGRLVGRTVDSAGRTGYVLTLQAREQHIRRERATSNICSNEALNALAATIYLSLLGAAGVREVALQCARKARYAFDRLVATGTFEPAFHAPFYQEFTLRYRGSVEALNASLLREGIIGGLDAGRYDPADAGRWIVAVTEKRTRAEIDRLAERAANAG